MDPVSEENSTSSPLQRLLIGGGTLIVVLLTVFAAVFLATQDLPDDQGTPVVNVSPTAVFVTNTPLPPVTSPTEPSSPPATGTPTLEPAPTDTPQLPTPTDTPIIEQPPTATVTPVPIPPSATPVPVATPPAAPPTATPLGANGDCPPPANWIVYLVQPGDTLEVLARRTNVSVFDLQRANCLESFALQPNQALVLPFPPPTATVRNTPTLTRIPGPTPTRTATPIAPRINQATVRVSDDIVTVIVIGEYFRSRDSGFRAQLVGPTIIDLALGEARTVTNFEATAPADQIVPGDYDLVVTNPDGFLDVEENVYPPVASAPTATPAPPIITGVSPSSGPVSSDVTVTIRGLNFQPFSDEFEVELRKTDGTLTRTYSPDLSRPTASTNFDIVIPANDLTAGTYDLIVINPNEQSDFRSSAYTAF